MAWDENDIDTFWSLDKLVPKKKAPLQKFTSEPSIVDYSIPTDQLDDKSAASDNRKLNFLETSLSDGISEIKYTPKSGLLKQITVKSIIDKYDFHANFVKAAKLYFDYYTHECEFEKFYSYMPQYSQLTHAQKNYYFYWRYCLRHGKYIKTDYSYFYLYVYEIINLPDIIPPKQGISLLIDVWCAYYKILPNVNPNMALWVQDYCLVHGIECPIDRIKHFVFSSIGVSGLKEFYLPDTGALSPEGVSTLISFLSDYDWRNIKFAVEKRDVYATHFIGAMSMFFEYLFISQRSYFDTTDLLKVERTAFRGALTTQNSKFRLIIEYKPIIENIEIRKSVTSAVKYTENKLRALIGVKSRLAVKDFSEEYKSVIDKYFETLFEQVNRKRINENRPEYERLYDAESEGFSAKDAEYIEKNSWSVTARLVIEEDDAAEENITQNIANPIDKVEQCVDDYGLNKLQRDFIQALLVQNCALAKEIVDSIGGTFDSVTDEINSAFADNFGDIVLVPCDDGYEVIEDYKEDVELWLQKTTK